MPTANVVAKFVNAPRAGSRYGSIKDANGEYWSVPATMLTQFAVNGSYQVEYDTTDKDGKTYKNIKKLMVGGPTQPANLGKHYLEDPRKAEDIAVLAIVKEWVGKIPVGDTEGLAHALRSARTAWRNSKVPGQDAPVDPEFDDQIPY